ncbi:MAG: hypothetical protein ACI3Y0_10130 [Prevotella sp.]
MQENTTSKGHDFCIAASLELKEIIDMPESQITDKGTGRLKPLIRVSIYF